MPVDYVTLKLEGYSSEQALNNPMLDFSLNYNEHGVVVSKTRIAEIHFCKIVVYESESVYFKGSLHKMYNSLLGIKAPNWQKDKSYKGYNGNQFTVENLNEVISYLEQLFCLERCFFKIQKIEVGVNIILDFCSDLIISNLLELKGKPFEFRYNAKFAVCEKSEYYLKVYNKCAQYGMINHVLRVELKSRKVRVFEQANIKTLADLINTNLKTALNIVLKHWNSVLLYDCTIDATKLTTRDKNSLNCKFKHSRYWNELPPNNKDKPRKKYNAIVENHSQNLKKQIAEKIKSTKISLFK